MQLKEIPAAAKTIDPQALAVEILDWAGNPDNVAYYVDNADTIYRLYFGAGGDHSTCARLLCPATQ